MCVCVCVCVCVCLVLFCLHFRMIGSHHKLWHAPCTDTRCTEDGHVEAILVLLYSSKCNRTALTKDGNRSAIYISPQWFGWWNPPQYVTSWWMPQVVCEHCNHCSLPSYSSDDEVVHSKRLGNKVLVDWYRSNPLIVTWDALVGQKVKHCNQTQP